MTSPRLWRETAARWLARWPLFLALWESLIPARSKAREDVIRLEALPLAPLTAVLDDRNTENDSMNFRKKGGTGGGERTRLPILVLSTK
ncbi:MAG: hypothetical protein AB1656_26010 [Candidatus Omnitrophota bacterium]